MNVQRMAAGSRRFVQPADRRGIVLVAVLVTLTLVGLMGVAVTRLTVLLQRSVVNEERHLSREQLSRAAREHAAETLARDATYAGETWLVSATELGAATGARLEIHVEPVGAAVKPITVALVRVQVWYPWQEPVPGQATPPAAHVREYEVPRREP